ncbi:MAG: MmgE/PrpD family protein, partial [Gammaproteobacteria bacterium]|nr:MmgE/PrpD family protein [Gammaproteobacteria bacterium]
MLTNQDLAACALAPPREAPADGGAALAALLAALERALRSTADPRCARLLGPVVPGATMTRGARVPGTSLELDPVAAAFAIGVAAGWSAEPGAADPSPLPAEAACVAGLLALYDHRSRRAHDLAEPAPRVEDLLDALRSAYRIQRMLELEPGYQAFAGGMPVAVRAATAAVAVRILGGRGEQIAAACTEAFRDGGAAPRHPRAAVAQPVCVSRSLGDANSRGLRLAFLQLAADDRPPSTAIAQPAAASGGRAAA